VFQAEAERAPSGRWWWRYRRDPTKHRDTDAIYMPRAARPASCAGLPRSTTDSSRSEWAATLRNGAPSTCPSPKPRPAASRWSVGA